MPFYDEKNTGSGGYLGYVLLGYDCGRFEELLRIEGLNHGTLTVSGNALVQREAFYDPGAPNCSPAGFKTVEWFWNGEDFAVRPKARERNFVYKSFHKIIDEVNPWEVGP